MGPDVPFQQLLLDNLWGGIYLGATMESVRLDIVWFNLGFCSVELRELS